MRQARAIVILIAALALAACGASAQQQVKAKIQQFAGAAGRRDYRTMCGQVLAPALVVHLSANRIDCVQAMRIAFGQVSDPTISVGKVTVKGQTATAIALSMARGQQSSIDTIRLVQTDSGWRISALGSPLR
jgi:ketosteroid isomerase-like protein